MPAVRPTRATLKLHLSSERGELCLIVQAHPLISQLDELRELCQLLRHFSLVVNLDHAAQSGLCCGIFSRPKGGRSGGCGSYKRGLSFGDLFLKLRAGNCPFLTVNESCIVEISSSSDLNLSTCTSEETFFSRSSQSAMNKSPVQPPAACKAYPVKMPGDASVILLMETIFVFLRSWMTIIVCS